MGINGASFGAGKGYTNQVALGLTDISIDNQRGIVTFSLNDGSSASWQFPIPANGKDGQNGLDGLDGKDGVSVVDAVQTDSRHFRLIYSDGTKSDLITIPMPEGGSTPLASEVLMSDGKDVETAIVETELIAKGRATGYVFDTVEDLDSWLEDDLNVGKLVLGDNLYVRATDVPDYWWDGSSKQKLETQKVDLTDYATKAYVDAHSGGGGSSSDVYSEDETVIGTFLGKPLYRKVFKGNITSYNDSSNRRVFDSGVILDNVDSIVDVKGNTVISGCTNSSSIGCAFNIGGSFMTTSTDVNFSNGVNKNKNNELNFVIHIHKTSFYATVTAMSYELVLEYTKTTD